MTNQVWHAKEVTVVFGVLLALAQTTRANIFRWDTGEVIPGTDGITPGPGVRLDHRELEYADLGSFELTNANFAESSVTKAFLRGSTLDTADLTGANLTGANLSWSSLVDADLTRAVVREASLGGWTLSKRLDATASCQAKDLFGLLVLHLRKS